MIHFDQSRLHKLFHINYSYVLLANSKLIFAISYRFNVDAFHTNVMIDIMIAVITPENDGQSLWPSVSL